MWRTSWATILLPFLVAGCGADGRDDPASPDAGADASVDAARPDAGEAQDSGAGEDSGARIDPVLISMDPRFDFEAETHVVAGGGRVLAVWMGLSQAGVANGYALGVEGGAEWSAPEVLDLPSRGDPVATVGPDGSFFYGFLDGTCGLGGCDEGHVWIARMPPGETTFDDPVDVSPADPDEFYDKPWLMTASDGSLVAVFAARIGDYPDNLDRIVVARSDDGLAWSSSDAVAQRPLGQVVGIPHACISAEGSRLWVVHVDTETPILGSIRWSDDLGRTWPAQNTSAGFAPEDVAAQIQLYDLRCAGEGEEVWVMYGLSSSVSPDGETLVPLDSIHLAYSDDAGLQWAARGVIEEPGVHFLRPEIVREPSGALDVIAYTGAEEGDRDGSVRWWRSTDGGDTFEEQSEIGSPIHFTGERGKGSSWIGDYSGLFFDRDGILVTFVDNSSGTSHIAFARLPVDG